MPQLTPERVRRIATAISLARLSIGVTVLAAPQRSSQLARIDDQLTPAGEVMMALFAVREIVVGTGCLLAMRRQPPTTGVLLLNAICDAGDLTVLLRALSQRRRLGRLPLAVPVAAAVAVSWLAMGRASRTALHRPSL